MTRDQLAELVGVSLTRRLRSGAYWATDPPGVKVRPLADAVAGDIFDQLQEGEGQ